MALTEENALQNHLHSTKIKDFPMIHGSEESLKAGFMLPPQNLDQNSQKVIYSLVLDLDETLIHFEQQVLSFSIKNPKSFTSQLTRRTMAEENF